MARALNQVAAELIDETSHAVSEPITAQTA